MYVFLSFLRRAFNVKRFLMRLFRVSPVMPMTWPLGLWFLEDPIQIGRDHWLGLLPVYISNRFRRFHEYILGKTGKGKSKYVEDKIRHDVSRSGGGVGVIDPHSDLANDVLRRLWSEGFFGHVTGHDDKGKSIIEWNKAALDKVIYYEPWRDDYVIPFDVLNIPSMRSDDLAENIIEAFKKAWPDSLKEAPRFVNVALPAFRILIESKQTLVQFRKFLINKPYRDAVLLRVQDKQLAKDFVSEFEDTSNEELRQIESVWNKLTRFTYYRPLRRTLGQATNVLNFKTIMDEQKVLIVNLHRLGYEIQALLGCFIVLGFQQAAFEREGVRVPFQLYCDEFPRYVITRGTSEALSTMLSEARKFGLLLILIHQQISQINAELSGALGNVGIKVVFASDNEDARSIVHKIFIPKINNFEPIHWERITAVIERLPEQTAFIKVDGWEAGCFRTEPLPPYTITDDELEQLKIKLMETHGLHYSKIPVDEGDEFIPTRFESHAGSPLPNPFNYAPSKTVVTGAISANRS